MVQYLLINVTLRVPFKQNIASVTYYVSRILKTFYDLNLKVKIGNPLIFFCSLNTNVLLDVSNCLTPWQVTVYVNRYDGR